MSPLVHQIHLVPETFGESVPSFMALQASDIFLVLLSGYPFDSSKWFRCRSGILCPDWVWSTWTSTALFTGWPTNLRQIHFVRCPSWPSFLQPLLAKCSGKWEDWRNTQALKDSWPQTKYNPINQVLFGFPQAIISEQLMKSFSVFFNRLIPLSDVL